MTNVKTIEYDAVLSRSAYLSSKSRNFFKVFNFCWSKIKYITDKLKTTSFNREQKIKEKYHMNT